MKQVQIVTTKMQDSNIVAQNIVKLKMSLEAKSKNMNHQKRRQNN